MLYLPIFMINSNLILIFLSMNTISSTLNLDLDLLLILISLMLLSDYTSLSLLLCLSGLFELIFLFLFSLIDDLNLSVILKKNFKIGMTYSLILILLAFYMIHLMILEKILLKGLIKSMMKNSLFLDDIILILRKISSKKLLDILITITLKDFLLRNIDIEKLLFKLFLNT